LTIHSKGGKEKEIASVVKKEREVTPIITGERKTRHPRSHMLIFSAEGRHHPISCKRRRPTMAWGGREERKK